MAENELQQFLYVFHPGERPELSRGEGWTEADEKVASDHWEYIQQGYSEKIVFLAGRSQDWVGPAIVILQTETEEAAQKFMEADPFVKNGLFKATLHPYRTALIQLPGE